MVGGVELSALRLLEGLRTRGYEFVVVALKDYCDRPEEDSYAGIPVY